MESLSHFRTIEELIKVLDREKKLLGDMFERRKSLAYRTDFAMQVVDNHERIQFLIDHGVLHENGDFLELDDVYVNFFEEVLDMNEEISIASVREYIESLKDNINYYREENNEQRKSLYYTNIRKILRRIGLRTLKNVVDLKRNVDDTYKQEQNYRIKKEKLAKLDEKRENIQTLMDECEKIIDSSNVFFSVVCDAEMQRTCMDVRNDFTEAAHSLLEIERQIIKYLNQIEHQTLLYKKIRRLKYLKDQLTWREDTNVVRAVDNINPVWMENRPYNRFFLSLDMLRTDDEAQAIIRKIADKANIRRQNRAEAEPIDAEFMSEKPTVRPEVSITRMWNAFLAQGRDLFNFIREYNYSQPRELKDHLVLYCQIATIFSDNLKFTDEYEEFEKVNFQIIYASEHRENI